MIVWKPLLFFAVGLPLSESLLAADVDSSSRRHGATQQHLRAAAGRSAAPRNLTAALTVLRSREPSDEEVEADHKAWQGPEGEEYDVREKRIERRCEGLEKCRELCAWIKRSLMKKYGSSNQAYEAADADGDGKVADAEFMDQCVSAGVSDAAMSSRGYIFLYVADINLDGEISRDAYQRIFRIAEAGDFGETPGRLDADEKRKIEESKGWGEVKIKEDFEPQSSTSRQSTTTTASTTTETATTEAAKEEKGSKEDDSSWFKKPGWLPKAESKTTEAEKEDTPPTTTSKEKDGSKEDDSSWVKTPGWMPKTEQSGAFRGYTLTVVWASLPLLCMIRM